MSETAPDIPSNKDKIQLLLLDCDGVLTDGGVTWSEDGIEHKTFNIRDGLGIKLWQQAGFKWVSSRDVQVTLSNGVPTSWASTS